MTFEEFEHGRAKVGNVHLHYRIGGSGAPVVLLHG
jgi:pimeloyl-ACP methyl ester carboxylesterase